MTKKQKKKVIRRITLLAVIFALLVVAVIYLIGFISGGSKRAAKKDGYIASDSNTVALFKGEETIEKGFLGRIKSRSITFSEGGSIPRGSEVTLAGEPEKDENGNILYEKIITDGQVFYIEPGHFVEDKSKVVPEKTKYVRTSVTIYENDTDAKIAGFAKKGSELAIEGYNVLNPDGSVDMYKVSFGGTEGWVFGKYLVNSKEDADAMYDGNGKLDYHRNAVYAAFELYGGDPLSLDYYPFEKPEISGNELLRDVRAMYMEVGSTASIDDYIAVAKKHGANAICVDIQENGILSFNSDIAAEMSPSEFVYSGADNFGTVIKKIKDAGLYAIGRIVTFKDSAYANDHPEDCIVFDGTDWPSAYSRDIWYYKVSLAIEAVEKFGFNEIQFDYVRFPENAWGMSESGYADFKNEYGEDKCEAVQNFLFYAVDMIHRAGAYVSVDVFGECSGGYVTAYGQYWPAISNVVDVISAMPYVDHFERDPALWENPYNTLYNWGKTAARDQETIDTPAVARTWVTAYDVPFWAPASERIFYGAQAVSDQAKGLWDAGLTGGFLTWNAVSSLQRYDDISWAWSKQYQ